MTNYNRLHTKGEKKGLTHKCSNLCLLTTVNLINRKTKWKLWVSVTTCDFTNKQFFFLLNEERQVVLFCRTISETLAAHCAMNSGWFHIFSFLFLFIVGNSDTAAGREDVNGESHWDNLPLRQHTGQKYWNSVTGRLKQTNQWKAIIDLFVL